MDAQTGEAGGTEVGEFVLFPVRPQILDRIEFGRVGGKKFQPQPFVLLADQRMAQRITSGAVCRHLNITGRDAFFTILSGYQPLQPKLQHIQSESCMDFRVTGART